MAVTRWFIHHHLGLGDAFTCNALVRTLVERTKPERVDLFAKECNAENVRFLYRDDPRIHVVPLPLARDRPIGERRLVAAYVQAHGGSRSSLLRIGFGAMRRMHRAFGQSISCDQAFYAQVGLPYERRFSGFALRRDPELEENAFQRFNPSGEPYAFVDADPTRGMVVPTMNLASRHGANPSLRQLFNRPDIRLMHMGLILERAEELHLCESSIRCLVEAQSVFRLSARRLFLHAFRGGIWGANTSLPWTQLGPGDQEVSRPAAFRDSPAQQALVHRATRATSPLPWFRSRARRAFDAFGAGSA